MPPWAAVWTGPPASRSRSCTARATSGVNAGSWWSNRAVSRSTAVPVPASDSVPVLMWSAPRRRRSGVPAAAVEHRGDLAGGEHRVQVGEVGEQVPGAEVAGVGAQVDDLGGVIPAKTGW